jgi:hypothetical protein
MNPNESRKYYEAKDTKRRASMDTAGTSPTNKFGLNFGTAGAGAGAGAAKVHPMEHQASLQQLYHERRMSGGSATAKK